MWKILLFIVTIVIFITYLSDLNIKQAIITFFNENITFIFYILLLITFLVCAVWPLRAFPSGVPPDGLSKRIN